MSNQNLDTDFTTLIEQHKRIIFKIANIYCHKNDREDLVQDIIFQLWKSWGNYNRAYTFSTWLYRVALNVAISFYRKEKRFSNTVSFNQIIIEVADTETHTEMDADIKLLQQFIQELNPLDKALMLLYLEAKSYKEIAEILGITETNVATKISRTKNILKHKFLILNK